MLETENTAGTLLLVGRELDARFGGKLCCEACYEACMEHVEELRGELGGKLGMELS